MRPLPLPLSADGALTAEYEPRQLLEATDGERGTADRHCVSERRIVPVAEIDRHRAYRRASDALRIERHRVEGGARRANHVAGVATAAPAGRCREPQRRAVGIVGEPGREDHVVLVIDRESPAGFGTRRCLPPCALEVQWERWRWHKGDPLGPKRNPVRTYGRVEDRIRPCHPEELG